MNKKLTVSNLTPAKRQQIERTKEWLLRLLAEAEAKHQQLESLTAAFHDARSRRDQYDQEAANNEDAALKLSAANIQVRKLDPQIQALKISSDKDLQTIALQIDTVRKEDISRNVSNDLAAQLHAELRKSLEPFFVPKYLNSWVDELLPSTWGFQQLLAYDARPAPKVTSIAEAGEVIHATVNELDAILSGEALLEITSPKDPPEISKRPSPSARESHLRMLSRLTAMMKKENPISAADYGQPISTDIIL